MPDFKYYNFLLFLMVQSDRLKYLTDTNTRNLSHGRPGRGECSRWGTRAGWRSTPSRRPRRRPGWARRTRAPPGRRRRNRRALPTPSRPAGDCATSPRTWDIGKNVLSFSGIEETVMFWFFRQLKKLYSSEFVYGIRERTLCILICAEGNTIGGTIVLIFLLWEEQ